jgi:hypothetical protein
MQTLRIVSRLIAECLPTMHAVRRQALIDVCHSAVCGHWLSLSALAFGTSRPTSLRHRVKCVDRLLGNQHLHQERQHIYAALAHRWLSDLPQLLIVVDWSSLSADMQWHWLRASVVLDGRSVTLYEEVHPRRLLANRGVHQRFIERLSQMMPATDRPPIILTDAGFRTTWFQLLARHGWHWVGRIRNRDFVSQSKDHWFPAKALYDRAQKEPQDLGFFQSVRSNPISARLVLAARSHKGRTRKYRSGKEALNSQTKKIAACQREPWLLSCSPGLAHLSARAIVSLYAQRMRIEQQFRDTKNCSLGAGLRQSRSQGVARLQMLLLIDHVAALVKRLIGEAAHAFGLQLQLVSTNRSDRREISVMTLARRVIAQPPLMRSLGGYLASMIRLRHDACAALNTAEVAP